VREETRVAKREIKQKKRERSEKCNRGGQELHYKASLAREQLSTQQHDDDLGPFEKKGPRRGATPGRKTSEGVKKKGGGLER